MSRLAVWLVVGVVAFWLDAAQAGLLITQYYEGVSNDKWVELTNTSGASVDLSGFKIGLWTNANTEAWKTATGSPTNTINLTGSLDAATSFLIKNSSAALPTYAVGGLSTTSLSPNGDDSIVLYTNASGFATANIVDAVSFTDAGNEGTDTSWVRVSLGTGFNLTTGSNVEDFPSVWSEATLAAVNAASGGANERLGVFVVPEPSVLAMCGVVALAGCTPAARRFRGQAAVAN